MIKELTHISNIESFLASDTEVFVVIDRNVAHLAGGLPWPVLVIETSEARKTLDSVQGIGRWLMEAGASRKALVLAIGGGITTDMTGFAASMYKRGIRYANVPTTLLAQVDAAIGGKTGVNLDGYKNMLGAFHMPEYTFICPSVLETLPAQELRCGMAEMLKTFLIGDADAYAKLVAEPEKFGELIARAAQIKAGIVERDPMEHGERAVLNLGHTFGHAIEHCSGGKIPHGEAVGMGIILAAKLSEGLGLASKGLAAQLEADFQKVGLETACPFGIEQLYQAMKKDKKDGKFVLLEAIGRPVITTVKEDDLYKYTK